MATVTIDFPGAARLLLRRPQRVLLARVTGDVIPAIRAAESAASAGAWVAGFIAYEAAPAFDTALTTRPPDPRLPLAWFGVYDAPEPVLHTPAAAPAQHGTAAGDPASALSWSTPTSPADYDVAIAEIRRRIAAGDVYQVNHTIRFAAAFDGEPAALHDALVRARHGRYHACIETDAWAVVSASPELFFDVHGRTITTRPMKGTLRRGRWLEEDRAAAAALASSAKDRAENLMIVDLLRNDLGRIARFGTVRVPALFTVESYPTVHQLTSTITAELRADVTLCDILAATFPCGSVTGAPKVTAMRTIAALEAQPRGVYCGAVGIMRPDGSATFNVAIRTVLIDRERQRALYGAGGGITWDSHADAEYGEVVAKTALLTETVPYFELIETMRMDDGVIARRKRHMSRLRASAACWFGESIAAVAADAATAAIDDCAAQHPGGAFRVRLLVAPDGAVQIAHTPLAEPERTLASADDIAPRCVAIARAAVRRTDRLLFHKTTARTGLDGRRADFPDLFDVLLCNEEGLATEFTTGNLVVRLAGQLLTPALDHGLLPGTMRAQLLDQGSITEARIAIADVRRAERLYHINSVRGVTPVRLVDRDRGAAGAAAARA
jgi:para-aminobenzoate synthetase/4-amino-4-deoxychorismate lyase